MDPLTKEACSSGIRVRVQGQHADPHGENDINIVYLANSDLTLRELCNRPTSRMGSNLEKTNMSRDNSVKTSLYVRLEAKPGKEKEVASFLEDGLALANKEPKTIVWFALRLGPSTFGIFDAFPDEAGRQAHLDGPIAAALMAKASDLLSAPPRIDRVEVLASKIP